MAWREFLWYRVVAAAGFVAGLWTVYLVWHLRGKWKIRRAGPRRLVAIRHRIWREPSIADASDLRYGPGGAEEKDRRDVARGSNTAIFEVRSRFGREARYLITDWGGAMGRWGSNIVSRDRWDPAGFEQHTVHFVTGVRDGYVSFGYQGQRTAEIARGITVEHAAWFYRYARRITEPAFQKALIASGADREEADVFARALVERIRQLGEACGLAPPRVAKAG
ncbi:MAG: hypothetical protein ACRD3G_07415 [Vicinamibacterales bacterium]